MPKYVYDFTEGNKDLKDLLGGKGANLAEMTNLGLPVPPGFTITTEACTTLPDHRQRAAGARRRGQRSTSTRWRRRWAASSATPTTRCWSRVRSGAKFSMPGHDGDGPQHRPQRRVGAGPGQAVRQRAVRLGLLPPADPDVRQDRARHRRRALRGRHRRGQEGQGHHATTSTSTRTTCSSSSRQFKGIVREHSRPRVPAGPARADGPRRPGRLRLVERRPRDPLPPPGAHPGRPRHRGQRACRWCSATSAWTPAPASRSPATRAPAHQGVYGDYLQNAQGEDVVAGIRNTRPAAGPRGHRQAGVRPAAGDHGDAGEPLPGPVRHRVHHRAQQALDAADPGRQAHRRRRVPDRHPARRRGPDRHGRGGQPGHRRAARPADVPDRSTRRPTRSRSPRA